MCLCRAFREELRWWVSWVTATRRHTVNRGEWSVSRVKPSDRWPVGPISPPVSQVSGGPSCRVKYHVSLWFVSRCVFYRQMRIRCTCSDRTITAASVWRTSGAWRSWSRFSWSSSRSGRWSRCRVEIITWWCWLTVETSIHGDAENTVNRATRDAAAEKSKTCWLTVSFCRSTRFGLWGWFLLSDESE